MSLRLLRGACVIAALASASTSAPASAQTRLLIVSGLGGDPKYARAFAEMSDALARAARDRARLPDSCIVWLGEANPTGSRWYRGASRRENVERELAGFGARGDSSEQLVLVLIGHGSGEGAESRVSLPGPDLTAADFGRLLGSAGARRVALINLTSASGDMLPILASPGRVVVTATTSAFERNESQFGRFFVNAFAKDGADADKDGRISLLEAFQYAESETRRFYADAGLLATEHPQLADAGQLARRFFLSAAPAATGAADTRLAALYADRDRLDEQIQALKTRKTALAAAAYDDALERLLVALALNDREIRKLERGT